ncbi:ABC transporter permease [Paenarthrobacter sp. DKR-5]|uniref:ABC transporter permease n=1 Tax=Paenarthrobacter sp. DKR-5 TaxID=2835535 RepID=UPI001BDBC170|nr:ABC transporter permease [Paenarthrobacter sp. DKR-5]MBT1004227.1 ABC transporter permease [Paenarthrobacter sp. DKR-5]
MSTAAANRAHRTVGPGLAFHRVLNSEWIKFRTLRSTLILLAGTVLVMVGLSALSGWGIGQALRDAAVNPRAGAALSQPDLLTSIPTSGVGLAQLIIGSLGVLTIASEFSTGMIRSTFAAVPTRLPAFVAKAVVLTAVAYVVATASALLSYLVAKPILAQYSQTLSLDQAGVLQGILLSGVYVAAVALMGMALGAITRNSAGGIMSLVGLFFVAPIALQIIPGDVVKTLNKYSPSGAGSRLLQHTTLADQLEPWQGGLVLAAWTVALLAAAAALLKRRDV